MIGLSQLGADTTDSGLGVQPSNRSRGRRIAVMADASDAAGRAFIQAAVAAVEASGPGWSALILGRNRTGIAERLRGCAGLVAMCFTRDHGLLVDGFSGPRAAWSWRVDAPSQWDVGIDNESIGEMAGHHLAEHGATALAFCDLGQSPGAAGRLAGLRRAAAQLGMGPVRALRSEQGALPHGPMTLSSVEDAVGQGVLEGSLAGWLASLPSRCGVVADSDAEARFLTIRCRATGLAVPEDLLVIGIGDDDLTCQTASPSLSSVDLGAARLGKAATNLVLASLSGQVVDRQSLKLAPVGVVARRSTDIAAVGDADVLAALNLIRARACEPITAQQVYDAVPVSSRRLERLFDDLLGRSVHDEIARVRLARARQLIASGEDIESTARQCGFSHRQSFARWFREIAGMQPSEYRSRLDAAH